MHTDQTILAEGGCDTLAYYPVLTECAASRTRARTLSMFAELSFIAGREGDATDDWRSDMTAAVASAFSALRLHRRQEVERLLTAAFYAGCDQATIISAARPASAKRAAEAKAVLHGLHYQREDGHRTAAIEARSTAYLLARKLPIGADEAAACTIDALRDAGFMVPVKESSFVLEGAMRGVEEREAWEAASREFEEREASALDSILYGEANDA